MTTPVETNLTATLRNAAREAGLTVVSPSTREQTSMATPPADFAWAVPPDAPLERSLLLELSEAFDFHKPELLPEMTTHLREAAQRLRNPRPDTYVTLAGLPVSFSHFAGLFTAPPPARTRTSCTAPFHLENGTQSPLHALVSASMTVTFAEIVPAPEQPYAETFIYNAVRKTLDRGQLELLKSGNRQPVPVTTRYYSRWQKKFFFTDTDDRSRMDFLALKVYWLSGVLGGNQPVWIPDPRDAQYLNTTPEELSRMAADLARQGMLALDGDYASATPALLGRSEEYRAKTGHRTGSHAAHLQRGDARRPHQHVVLCAGLSRCGRSHARAQQAACSSACRRGVRATWAWPARPAIADCGSVQVFDGREAHCPQVLRQLLRIEKEAEGLAGARDALRQAVESHLLQLAHALAGNRIVEDHSAALGQAGDEPQSGEGCLPGQVGHHAQPGEECRSVVAEIGGGKAVRQRVPLEVHGGEAHRLRNHDSALAQTFPLPGLGGGMIHLKDLQRRMRIPDRQRCPDRLLKSPPAARRARLLLRSPLPQSDCGLP